MALTLTKVALVDPSQVQRDFVGTPLDATIYTVDLTLGATSDYSSGIDLTSSVLLGASGIGCTQVIGVLDANLRTSGGVFRPYQFRFDQTNKTLRFFRSGGNTGGTGTAQANVSTNETILAQTNLPAGFFTMPGQAIWVTAWGTLGATGNNKTFKLNLGGTGAVGATVTGGTAVLSFAAMTQNSGSFNCIWQLVATGSAAQVAGGTVIASTAANTILATGSGSVDMTAARLLNITGTSGTASSDINLTGATFLGVANEITTTDIAASDVCRMTLVCV